MAVKLSPREKAALATQMMNKAAAPYPAPANLVETPVRQNNSVQIGLSMAGHGGKVTELEKKLSEAELSAKLAQEKLSAVNAEWQDVLPAKKIDPKRIKPSKWANRHDDSFTSKEYEELKEEIKSQGGNVQPIKVRPIVGSDTGDFEIVFGHRRHRACLESGLDVLAFVESVTDQVMFAEMDRENRQRADLRPFEQGVMYAKALDEGLFPSLRKMAEALGVDVGNASKAITLAKLPNIVLAAFRSPMDLQQAWATPLSDALKKDPDIVLSRAKALSKLEPKPSATNVFKDLVGKGVVSNNTPDSADRTINGEGGKSGKIAFNRKKGTFEISLTGLDETKISAIEKAMKTLLA